MNIDKKPSEIIREIETLEIRPWEDLSDIERVNKRIDCIIECLDEIFTKIYYELKDKPLT